jgi:hypothetical protein
MRLDTFEYNKIKNIIIDYVEDIGKQSFTNGFYREKYENVLKDIYTLIGKLKDEYDIDLKNFMKKYENKIFGDNDFISSCSFMDSILYWYDKNKGILAGYTYHDSNEYEYYIKYDYGYHNYDMGVRYILQSFNNLDEYFKNTAENYMKGYLDNNQGILVDETFQKVKKYGNNYISYTNLYYVCESNKKRTYEKIIDNIEEDFTNKDIQYDIIDGIIQVNIGKEEIDNFPDKYLQEAKNEIDIKASMKKYNI